MSEEDKDYVLFSCLLFEDDTASLMKLYTGSYEECQKTMSMIDAVSNSSEKKPVGCFFRILLEKHFNQILREAGWRKVNE